MNGMHQWWSEVGDSRNVIVGATKLKKKELIASESQNSLHLQNSASLLGDFIQALFGLRSPRTNNSGIHHYFASSPSGCFNSLQRAQRGTPADPYITVIFQYSVHMRTSSKQIQKISATGKGSYDAYFGFPHIYFDIM